MSPLRVLSIVEQTAEHLRQGLQERRWSGRLPGVVRLATECDVSKGVVRAAFKQLESEGLLTAHGHGRSRTVADLSKTAPRPKALRVGILLHETIADENPVMQNTLLSIKHSLEEAGNVCFISSKCQAGLHHEVTRIAQYIKSTPADTWVVVAPRFELLEWLSTQPLPSIHLGARAGEFPLAGTCHDFQPHLQAATRQLLEMGHQRIVLICPRGVRHPKPARSAQTFMMELTSHGVRWSTSYNLPDWEETPEGYRALLTDLFRATPPTALIVDETPRLLATYAFLAERGWRVPEQISLITTQWDSSLTWCQPTIAHLKWDDELIIRRITRWVRALSQGRADKRMVAFPAEFVPGGSIGPVWKG